MKKNIIKLLLMGFGLLFQITLTQGQQLSLTPSNYNGYNVRCFGGNSGSIDMTITGGEPLLRILAICLLDIIGWQLLMLIV